MIPSNGYEGAREMRQPKKEGVENESKEAG